MPLEKNKKPGKNRNQEASKKRKVPNNPAETAAAKRTRNSDSPTSGSKESSVAPSRTTACSRRTTAMSEEDATTHGGEDAISVSDSDESEAESSEAELECLQRKWTSPIYAFFGPTPDIVYVGGRRCHIFHCSVRGCKQCICRFLDKRDASSTSNLCKHAISCWGEASVTAITTLSGIKDAQESVTSIKESGSVTAAFKKKGKGKVSFSHRQHTKTETKAEIVRWVSESLRPFKIVSDRGFKSLMKTGRPEYYIPSPSTVSRDIRLVFANVRKQMAKMLQEYKGTLNFATDAWTSPNHKAFMAVSVHFEQNGQPICLILDVVESHSGVNLAAVFAKILNEFGIAEKCLGITCDNASNNDVMIDELVDLLPNYPGAANRCRCFLHIVNLIAKTLLKQFEVLKKDVDTVLDAAEQELLELAAGADMEELVTVVERGLGDNEDVDDMDGWVNELNLLLDDENEELRQSIQPVRLVLVKLRKLAFKILHSTTKLLPAWRDYLEEFELGDRIMPRDVSTRWNLTFDMLNFAIEYCKAIDAISGDRDMELQ